MQEQVDEFRQREETTKAMYEKILQALNGSQDKSVSVHSKVIDDVELCNGYGTSARDAAIVDVQDSP
jgi:hypothetical protein